MRIPQVDKILRHPALVELQQSYRREVLAELVRQQLEAVRAGKLALQDGQEEDQVANSVAQAVKNLATPGLQKVINATGVVLNTNLGRAPLPMSVLESLLEIGSGYCNLEIDLDTGKRGQRSRRIAQLLNVLVKCEASLVVNNNAAAVLLAVNALARNKEVIVSRGELIEIGGSFRLPDVIEAAGATLKEVGTTNRTRLADFQKAINANSGLLIRCHRSNFEIKGFTEEASLAELIKLSAESGVPLLEDLGSGLIRALVRSDGEPEPTVEEVLKSGCELVCFSGDKLLGGPQAGVLVGKRALIEKLASHPLYRALRPDKLTLAALEQILISYLFCQSERQTPVSKMLSAPLADIKSRAESFAKAAAQKLSTTNCAALETTATAGGGSLPGDTLESWGVTISSNAKPDQLVRALRKASTPVIAIVQNDRVILDFRTVDPSEESLLLAMLIECEKSADFSAFS